MRNRLRAGIAAGAFLATTAAIVVWFTLSAPPPSADDLVTLEMVLHALDSGAHGEARALATRLNEHQPLSSAELSAVVYALGTAAAHEADETWQANKVRCYRLAAKYLEEARDRGFPEGYDGEGLYLLGKALYLSGQAPASRPILQDALKTHPQRATEIHRLLGGAYFHDANPKLPQALEENTLYLADRQLDDDARQRGLLERAEILFRLDRMAECAAALDQVPATTERRTEVTVLRGRILIRQAEALAAQAAPTTADQTLARQKYQEAIQTLRTAREHDTLSAQATAKAMYLIGVCQTALGDHRAAADQFTKTCRLYTDTPEALAAGLKYAELAQRLGRNTEALAGYRQVLTHVTDPQNFHNPWLSLDELRTRIQAAYQGFLGDQNFAASAQLAGLVSPLFTPARAARWTAEAHRAWGELLLAHAEKLPPSKAEPERRNGRAQWRRAGAAYAELARLEFATRQYPDYVWNTADAYLQGQDYTSAVRWLEEYLKNELRRRNAEALVALGKAQLSLDQPDKALESLRHCIEAHPRHAASFSARLLASRACVEQGKLPEARRMLQDNLESDMLDPTSREWRDSLFALGELLYSDRRYPEAMRRLEEAVERYPAAPQTVQARYLIADSCRQSAKTAPAEASTTAADSGDDEPTTARQWLEQALRQYAHVRETLNRRAQESELAVAEQSLLRNCYFAVGEVLFALGRYDEAVQTFSAIVNRYQNRPEALEGYVHLAAAYRGLSQSREARTAIQQAKAVLNRMKPETQFAATTNFTREDWRQRLDWLAGL